MKQTMVDRIAKETDIGRQAVTATIGLLDERATVPFIARYRKERTGGLDEVAIIAIRDTYERLQELDKRREAVLSSLREQGVLSIALEKAVQTAPTLAAVEDLYLPYRPKKRTRSTMAQEKGLGPLADLLLAQGGDDPQLLAAQFVKPDLGVSTPSEAIAGALDIVAERISENGELRMNLRRYFATDAQLRSKRAPVRAAAKGADTEAAAAKYRDYFDWSEPAARAPSHRILAVFRGQNEKVLSCHATPSAEPAVDMVVRKIVRRGPAAQLLTQACEDSYKRLIEPALENELMSELKKRADHEAVRVFAANLRELLMASPLGGRAVLAVDPGFRTGCKLACLDARGNLLHSEPVYALEPHRKTEEATRTIRALVKKYAPYAVAIGNGTGGREMFAFCKELGLTRTEGGEETAVVITMVNESGASVYSASDVARAEFPDQDVTVRGAVSIGRRLMDPLAELVKIDPKSIGVGQYQHDVDQKLLKAALDDVVSSCVNSVGVELNTASVQLLSAVSGLNERLAQRVVEYRTGHNGFASREELSEVSGIGPRVFEQCAGFLRIRDGRNPLDASAVHPESYPVVEAIAKDAGCTPAELLQKPDLRAAVRIERYVSETVGLPTLQDILAELEKPGRDPRSEFSTVAFADDIRSIDDLKEGMRLPGVITNVAAFGAFVDIGVHQDGLVHISELADRFVQNPAEIVHVGQQVMVTVVRVEKERRRIGLSMKNGDRSVTV